MKPHLRPEQQQKLDQIMEKMQKHGHMHGHPPPPPVIMRHIGNDK